MDRNKIIAAIALILLLGTGAWIYSHYRSAPEIQAPSDGEASRAEAEATVLQNLKKDWPRLEQGPLKHAAESGHWFLDAVEFIGPKKILAHFEDGLNDEYALLNQLDNGAFEVARRFTSSSEFQDLQATSSYSSSIYQYDAETGAFIKNPEYKIFEASEETRMEIKIALLNPDGSLPNQAKAGDITGCDHVTLATRLVPRTEAPLTAALKALLAEGPYEGHDISYIYNFVATGKLALQSVEVQDGLATIRLTGTPPPLNGVCDDPRLFVQVAQTARQFPTVQKVRLYVNGKENTGSSNES